MAESTREEWLGMPARGCRPDQKREMISLLTLDKYCHQFVSEKEVEKNTWKQPVWLIACIWNKLYTVLTIGMGLVILIKAFSL